MKIDILTLFPKMFRGPFEESIIARAQKENFVKINIYDLRRWSRDHRKTVDDRPYGGGTGMILMIEPIYYALEELKQKTKAPSCKVILLGPKGKVFTQSKARKLAQLNHLILIAGHYEDVDHRVRKYLIDEEISIGDYILTGGELPAMVIVDSIVRLIPGVLKKSEAIQSESFTQGLLEYPQYTRPENFKGWKVPKILLSGNHKKIEKWRAQKALELTKKNRPDLLKNKAA
jgi:tRNA (guanine37-N1)-methyltransferase